MSIRKAAAALIALGFLATPALAEMPAKYKKCKTCHGIPGKMKKTLGPNLSTSKMTIDQWQKMVENGSTWDGRPAKQAGFEKKKMPAQKGVSKADVQAIYDFAHKGK